MPNRKSESSLRTGPAVPRTAECPRVADLIDYALGLASGENRRQVEAHLQRGECSWCRSWIHRATGFRQEPWLDEEKLSANPPLAVPNPSPPTSFLDRTPFPENSKWQRQAFRDLKKRLKLLEES